MEPRRVRGRDRRAADIPDRVVVDPEMLAGVVRVLAEPDDEGATLYEIRAADPALSKLSPKSVELRLTKRVEQGLLIRGHANRQSPSGAWRRMVVYRLADKPKGKGASKGKRR